MTPLTLGPLRARLATGPGEVAAAQRLRQRAFRPDAPPGRDADAFDARARHLLVEETATGQIRACCRLLLLPEGCAATGYAAQFYNLTRLARRKGPLLEMGRFCLAPGTAPGTAPDPDVLRLAWAAIGAEVDASGAQMLIGCASFPGTDPAPHAAALGQLARAHLAPPDWAPGPKAPQNLPLAPFAPHSDPATAQRNMPGLLRSYLAMGGRVSDHAVTDPDLGTLHVFTGVEIAAIPPARQRALRALAAAAH